MNLLKNITEVLKYRFSIKFILCMNIIFNFFNCQQYNVNHVNNQKNKVCLTSKNSKNLLKRSKNSNLHSNCSYFEGKTTLNTLLKVFIGISLIGFTSTTFLNDNNSCHSFDSNKTLCEMPILQSNCVWDLNTEKCYSSNKSEVLDLDQSRRRLEYEECIPFTDYPRSPKKNIYVDKFPWLRAEVCKLFMNFPTYTSVCTGSIIGPYHILTARHCTVDSCYTKADKVIVACGYGYTDYSYNYYHYGTAEIEKCLKYDEYDDDVYDHKSSCTPGYSSVNVGLGYDIQICKLDRKLGLVLKYLNHSYFELDSSISSSINVEGYPGYVEGLEKFISNHEYKRFLHPWVKVTNYSNNVIYLENAWIFPGESGAPYHVYSSNLNSLEVIGVHLGGPTGCNEYGTRVTNDLIQKYNNLDWIAPYDHCQPINYNVDFLNKYYYPLKGVGLKSPDYYYTEQYQFYNFKVRLTLFNVGTKKAENVEVKFYSSLYNKTGYNETYLGSAYVGHISPYNTSQIEKYDLPVNWPIYEERYILATWIADYCKQDYYNNYTILGIVKNYGKHGSDRDDKNSANKRFLSLLPVLILHLAYMQKFI